MTEQWERTSPGFDTTREAYEHAARTDNEKLIEEARRAETAVYLATDARVADDLSRIIGGLADALEAAEKAHTPTDHERSVLLDELEAWQRHTGDAALGNLLRRVGSAIRRSEAHTPTDDERSDLIAWHVEQVEALRPFTRSSHHLKAAMMHAATVRTLRAAAEAGGVR